MSTVEVPLVAHESVLLASGLLPGGLAPARHRGLATNLASRTRTMPG
jgi:hypothetical protein